MVDSVFAVATAPRLPPHQGPGAGAEAGIKTLTCRSASWPVWPPLGGSPAPAQRWRGCSEACCPCPSPPRAGSAGRLCCGRWGDAPVPVYTVRTVGWGSPVGSEDEEKLPHIQATATETQSRHETSDSGFVFFFMTVLCWIQQNLILQCSTGLFCLGEAGLGVGGCVKRWDSTAHWCDIVFYFCRPREQTVTFTLTNKQGVPILPTVVEHHQVQVGRTSKRDCGRKWAA